MKLELNQEEKGREKRGKRRSWAVATGSSCIILALLSVVQAFSFWGAIVLAAAICLSAVALVRAMREAAVSWDFSTTPKRRTSQRRPNQKVVAMENLSPNDRAELADRLEAEFAAVPLIGTIG